MISVLVFLLAAVAAHYHSPYTLAVVNSILDEVQEQMQLNASLVIMELLFYSIVIFLGYISNYVGVGIVSGESMLPTFHPWFFAVYELSKKETVWNRDDIIRFHPPESERSSDFEQWVKRVIGVSGQTVRVTNGLLYVNDELQEEEFEATYSFDTVTVPPNKMLVLGDNREESCDSHEWEEVCLSVDNITGRVRCVISARGVNFLPGNKQQSLPR